VRQISLLTIAVCVLFPRPQSTAQQRPPIIDMHMHARVTMARTSTGQPQPRPCFPEPCQTSPAAAKTDADVLRLTLEAMDRYNIVLGFLSDSIQNLDKWVQAAPQRFLPSPMIGDPKKANIPALRKAYESGRLRGLGFTAIPPYTLTFRRLPGSFPEQCSTGMCVAWSMRAWLNA
jgi:hypothetical protein